jgi:hypothetical protein
MNNYKKYEETKYDEEINETLKTLKKAEEAVNNTFVQVILLAIACVLWAVTIFALVTA